MSLAVVQRAVFRLLARQRLVNLYVTNVPGPPVPLYLAGARLLELFPMVPIEGNLTLTLGVFSYAGQLNLTAVADRDACPTSRCSPRDSDGYPVQAACGADAATHSQLARVVWVPATFAAWMVVLCRVGAALPRHLSLGRLVWGVGGAICAAELHWRGKGPPSTRQGLGSRRRWPLQAANLPDPDTRPAL